jgi:FG-GAP repeat protein/VCBS repeat protein
MHRTGRLIEVGISLSWAVFSACGSNGSGTDGAPRDASPPSPMDSSVDGAPGTDSAIDRAITDASSKDSKPVVDSSPAVDAKPDLGSVAPPIQLTVSIKDRRQSSFELVWTAPADNGHAVAGYQIRYATVPITAANFDDNSVTKSAPYSAQPSAPGGVDGVVVRGLYIETGYFFGVVPTDAAGSHVGALMTTSAAIAAHFDVSLIPSPAGTNQSFGASLDGSGDVNGDGHSDLLVGTFNDNHAYLFFGGTNFAPTVPGVTFTGTNVGFGVAIAVIGDINHDGMEDIAVSDFPIGQRVFIYKGRLTWPMQLADTDADYVISTDASYAMSNFGSSLARLGDFNGDGVDDFVIGAPLFNTRVGKVVIVYGAAGFSSLALPDSANQRSLEINGDPALTRSQLGIAAVGLGHSYSVTAGTTFVVSATGLGTATNTSSNEGRIYAFHGRGPGPAIDASMADDMRVGPGKGAEFGQVLSNLGPIVGGLPSLGAGNTADTLTVPSASGTGFLFSGPPTSGLFVNPLVLYAPGESSFGQVFFGGGLSGSDVAVSLVGDATPDVVAAGVSATTLDIFDGAKLSRLASPVNAQTGSDIHMALPSGWTGTPVGPRNLMPDVNGDGYADFALGDVFGSVPGRVAVFW